MNSFQGPGWQELRASALRVCDLNSDDAESHFQVRISKDTTFKDLCGLLGGG